jgi:hypothetical protein
MGVIDKCAVLGNNRVNSGDKCVALFLFSQFATSAKYSHFDNLCPSQ